VPVDNFLVFGVIGDIDGDWLPFLEAKDWAGNLLVVGDGFDGALRGNVQRKWG
jgi:hypothetical protein